MLKILLSGARGRMGQAIKNAANNLNCQVAVEVDAGDDPSGQMSAVDVVVDFSVHSATYPLAVAAARAGKPLVIGTTGHSDAERAQILQAVESIPVVWAGNFSVGVNLLFYLTRKAAEILDSSFNPEIVEMHHKHKIDSPSGTAQRLLDVVLEPRGLTRDQVRYGRQGLVGSRHSDEVGMHSLRGGSVVGDHSVIFAGEGERFELSHKAEDRAIFAQGALKAARWVFARTAGLYNMEDVLGLK